MTKLQIIEKLKELGIHSTNCYPKKSFMHNSTWHVGLYKSELESDFYFFNEFDKTLYMFKVEPKCCEQYEMELFNGKTKYLIPLHDCINIFEDKPYEEKIDAPFRDITIRQYTCIHLRHPDSGLPWLDLLIKKANNDKKHINTQEVNNS